MTATLNLNMVCFASIKNDYFQLIRPLGFSARKGHCVAHFIAKFNNAAWDKK